MKTVQNSARMMALKKQIETGQIKKDKDKILAYAKIKGFFNIPEITRELGIARSTATARVSDLEDEGKVKNWFPVNVPGFKDPQGHYSYLDDEGEQRNHKWQRHYEKREQWIKRGQREGWLDESLNVVR